ncbi:hypothetical protein FVE85_2184 [Porphyridium purpureum]|uniref:Uncharacterized protein n=1 Tax=Porphyridium purpureum TaxID=35688 RepID=A0A5J4YWT6_PORPP|nr:hypothetical protein FVE85_2184 [Porphyridium purpureum]|eukprot:POR1590..scf209_3
MTIQETMTLVEMEFGQDAASASALSRRSSWSVAASVVAVMLMTVAVVVVAPSLSKSNEVRMIGKPLPNGMMRATYECDQAWYCAQSGADCSAGVPIGGLDTAIVQKCEFHTMANELTAVSTFLLLADTVNGHAWTCKDMVMNSCSDNMPFGCPYLDLCPGQQDELENVITAATEYTAGQAAIMPQLQQGWESFSGAHCGIAQTCSMAYDSNLCTKSTKMPLARKLVGKALAELTLADSTLVQMAETILCMTCEVQVGNQVYECLDEELQKSLGGLFGVTANNIQPLANKRTFTDVESIVIDPEWTEAAKCHPICKSFKKGNVGLYHHVYEYCCAAATFN